MTDDGNDSEDWQVTDNSEDRWVTPWAPAATGSTNGAGSGVVQG